MHESNINLLREEAQRLIGEEIKLLKEIQATPNLLTEKSESEQSFDVTSLPELIEQLEGESTKLESLDLVLAVVGTMKAGKSTTINAIVGLEVLPNRNRPMTALPTLIRHTPGVTKPRLLFNNTDPVNQLLKRLAKALPKASQEVVQKLNSNSDMKELLSLIKNKQSFTKKHDGTEAIFNFLKSLNDLVRLSTELNVEFPFSDYSRVESLPLIEVEFTHLSQMKGAQGRLTLLDTPGPNEAGQEHLRFMLQDQLKKASAVLAILDYTQLKSDADAEMRENLKNVAGVTGDRLFALVNRFDQEKSHSDNADEVRSYVSKSLMKDMIAPERVFPVSALYGYLAAQAKNELALNGKLPPHEKNAWVMDFAKITGGMDPESILEDVKRASKSADILWEKSLFNEPLDNVIREAYNKAAIFALDSSAVKIKQVVERAKNFLSVRAQAFKQNVEDLESQAVLLQKDIDHIAKQEQLMSEEVKRALHEVIQKINSSNKTAQDRIKKTLDDYFKEGKSLELQRSASHERSSGKKRSKQRSRVKKSQEVDFKATNGPIRFRNRDDAITLLKRIYISIDNALKETEEVLQLSIESEIEKFNVDFFESVEQAEQTIKKIKEGMHEFDLAIDTPDIKAIQLDFRVSDALKNAVQEKTTRETRQRRQSGAWGRVCGWFNTDDWGWEDYSVEVDVYDIDIQAIKEDIGKSLSSAFIRLEVEMEIQVQDQLSDHTEIFFRELREKVEHIRGDLIMSMEDRKKTESEQIELLNNLTKLEKPVPNLLGDTEALIQDVKGLLGIEGEK